jgi:hypothetical protein
MPSDHLDAEHSSSFDPQQGQREETHVAFLPGKKEGIRDHRGLAFLLTLVALVPVIVVIFQRTGHSYLPAADQALIDLRVRDVFSFSSNTPFLGPYSRFGWNHPGALLYYLLAVINWPLGNPAWGLLLGVALLEGIALAWTARLAWVFGGLKTLIPWVAVVSLSCLAVGPNVLEVIWGPNILLPFFVLFLLQCWVILCGDSRRLLGLVFVGTLLIQTHVGYAVPVIVLSLASVTWLYIGIKKNWIVHHARLTWRGPLILFVVLWFPPLVLDPLFHSRLNFVQIISSSNGGSTLGLHGALGYMAAEFHWVPPWLGGADVINPFLGTAYTQPLIWLLIPISLLAISGWAAFTKKNQKLTTLIIMLCVVFGVSILTLSQVTGFALPYLFYWRIVVGASLVILPLWALTQVVQQKYFHWMRAGFLVVLSFSILIASSVQTNRILNANGPITPASPAAQDLISQLTSHGYPKGPILIRYAGSTVLGSWVAVFDDFTLHGVPIKVDPGLGFSFGEGRTATLSQVTAVWYVTDQSQYYSILSGQPSATVLALSQPLTSEKFDQLVTLERTLASSLAAQGRANLIPSLSSELVQVEISPQGDVTKEQLSTLSSLNKEVDQYGCVCSVVSFPPALIPQY